MVLTHSHSDSLRGLSKQQIDTPSAELMSNPRISISQSVSHSSLYVQLSKGKNLCISGLLSHISPLEYLLTDFLGTKRGDDCLTSKEKWVINFVMDGDYSSSSAVAKDVFIRLVFYKYDIMSKHSSREWTGNKRTEMDGKECRECFGQSIIGVLRFFFRPSISYLPCTYKNWGRNIITNKDIIAEMCQPNHLIIINELLLWVGGCDNDWSNGHETIERTREREKN